MAAFFFYEVGTAVWPREFYYFVSKANSRGKNPLAIPWFLISKKKGILSFDSPWFGLSSGVFAIVYSSLVTLLWLIHHDSRNLRELTRRRPWKNYSKKLKILGCSIPPAVWLSRKWCVCIFFFCIPPAVWLLKKRFVRVFFFCVLTSVLMLRLLSPNGIASWRCLRSVLSW